MKSIYFCLFYLVLTLVNFPQDSFAQKKGANQIIKHTDAYKKEGTSKDKIHERRVKYGPHLNIKVTPPEKRGKENYVLVEIYNNSETFISVVDFYLYIEGEMGNLVHIHMSSENMKPEWADLKWLKIPGTGKIPRLYSVQVQNMSMYDVDGKVLKLPYYTELIKE